MQHQLEEDDGTSIVLSWRCRNSNGRRVTQHAAKDLLVFPRCARPLLNSYGHCGGRRRHIGLWIIGFGPLLRSRGIGARYLIPASDLLGILCTVSLPRTPPIAPYISPATSRRAGYVTASYTCTLHPQGKTHSLECLHIYLWIMDDIAQNDSVPTRVPERVKSVPKRDRGHQCFSCWPFADPYLVFYRSMVVKQVPYNT